MAYTKAREKTEQALHAAMLSLMRTKPLHSITVTELCSLCGLNRSTFYAHYATIDHLIRDLHEELFLLMEESLNLSPHTYAVRNEAQFTRFLIQICKEDERFRLFVRSEDANRFVSHMVDHFLTRFCPKDAGVARRNAQLYHMVGAFTLLCAWIHEGYPYPAEELAAQIIALSQKP